MTIIYTEKGHGLHAAIAAAGYSLRQENGEFTSDNDAVVQAIIHAYTLADAQGYKCDQVSAHAKALRDRVIRSISAGEMASWPIKLAEAAKYLQTTDPADAPMLSAEATARGIPLAALVAKVDGNATTFAGLEALIGGTDGKHRDAIKALTTFDDVAAYDFSTGWPEV